MSNISISIRQSGGANIVSLPKAVVQTLGLSVGSKLDLTLEGNRIILTPSEEVMTLEQLLAGSTKSDFTITEEDREWIDVTSVGKEL